MRIVRDELDSALWGESTGEIKFGNAHIPLPYPVLTSTDLNYASEFSREFLTPISFPNQVHESKKLWAKDFVLKVLDSREKQQQEIDWINANLMKAKDNAESKMSFFTPLLTKEVPVSRKIIDLLVGIQLDSELEIVQILDSQRLSQTEMALVIKENVKIIKDAGKEPFFLTSTAFDEELFKARLEIAKKTMSGITALYSNPTKHSQNFNALATSKEENFLRFLSNVDRRYPKFGKCNVVPIAMLCSDIFSSSLGMGGGSKKEAIKKEQTNARRLNNECLGHLTMAEHQKEYGEKLDCNCPVDRGNELSDLYIDHKGHLNDTFRTHEPYAVFEAVEQAREKINSGKLLEEYIHKKEYAKQAYEELFKWKQSNILSF